MVDRRLERSAARELLAELERSDKAERKQRRLRVSPAAEDFDLLLNASAMDTEQMAALIQAAVETLHVGDAGYHSTSADAQLQFQVRLELAKHGISPPDRVQLTRAPFTFTRVRRSLPTSSTTTASRGSTSRAVSRFSGIRTEKSLRHSPPTFTCRSSTFTLS